MFERYRAMFSLRNRGGTECVEAVKDPRIPIHTGSFWGVFIGALIVLSFTGSFSAWEGADRRHLLAAAAA